MIDLLPSVAPVPVAHLVSDLLRRYDEQLREANEVLDAGCVSRLGPLWLAVFSGTGFVTYRDLDDVDVDELIVAAIAHFRDRTEVDEFEWKTRGHDRPSDLIARLEAHGLRAAEEETVMIGAADALIGVDLPAGVRIRRLGPDGDLRADVLAMQEASRLAFGSHRGEDVDGVLRAIEAETSEYWVAEADGEVISSGRLTPVPGTDFAGIWGGGVVPQWRGRGVYCALVAARARSAIAGGVPLIHSDCTPMSRPILERSGLHAVTTTTPVIWHR